MCVCIGFSSLVNYLMFYSFLLELHLIYCKYPWFVFCEIYINLSNFILKIEREKHENNDEIYTPILVLPSRQTTNFT